MENRITPKNIMELKANEIFVFGSNQGGQHFGGAAKIAMDKFGAEHGIGYGAQGQCYAINTMDGLEHIEHQIIMFLNYAKQNADKIFLITPIGCGIAGHTPEEVAPLFKNAVNIKNIYLPESFWKIILEK